MALENVDYLTRRNVMVPMRDGVKLAADLYLPAIEGELDERRWPCVLVRTPYNKALVNPDLRNPGQYWTQHGYACCIQDCRGRFNSEGVFYKYTGEAEDGYDTVEWIASQPWCNGSVVTDGPSYLAHVQTAMAVLRPPHLRAMFCNKGGMWNAHSSGVRQGGAFEARQWVWGIKKAVNKQNPHVKEALVAVEKDIEGWLKRWPFKKGDSPLALAPQYEQYLFDQSDHSDYDSYWKQIGLNVEEHIDDFADVPAMFLSGWFDIYARSTVEFFTNLVRKKRGPILMIMGPWQHVGNENHIAGEVDFGVDALLRGNLAVDMYSLTRRWFDRWVDPPRPKLAPEGEAKEVKERSSSLPVLPPQSLLPSPDPLLVATPMPLNSIEAIRASESRSFSQPPPSEPSSSLPTLPSSTLAPPPLSSSLPPLAPANPSPSHQAAGQPLQRLRVLSHNEKREQQPLPPRVRYFRMGGGDGHKTTQGCMFHGGTWMQCSDWPPPGTRDQLLFLTRRTLVTATEVFNAVTGAYSTDSSAFAHKRRRAASGDEVIGTNGAMSEGASPPPVSPNNADSRFLSQPGSISRPSSGVPPVDADTPMEPIASSDGVSILPMPGGTPTPAQLGYTKQAATFEHALGTTLATIGTHSPLRGASQAGPRSVSFSALPPPVTSGAPPHSDSPALAEMDRDLRENNPALSLRSPNTFSAHSGAAGSDKDTEAFVSDEEDANGFPPPDSKANLPLVVGLVNAEPAHSRERKYSAFSPHPLPAAVFDDPERCTTYQYDPRRPCPTLGGNVFPHGRVLLSGAFNQVEREDMFLCERPFLPLSSRRDVVVFRTAPLAEDIEVSGTPLVVLYIASSAVDTDFTAKLIDEYPPSADYPAGFAMQITHGIQRCRYRDSREHATLMQPGSVYEIRVELFPTSNLFQKGHRLRLDISSSNFPHFDINMNTGAGFSDQRSVVADNSVLHSHEYPSRIVLPVVHIPPPRMRATKRKL